MMINYCIDGLLIINQWIDLLYDDLWFMFRFTYIYISWMEMTSDCPGECILVALLCCIFLIFVLQVRSANLVGGLTFHPKKNGVEMSWIRYLFI